MRWLFLHGSYYGLEVYFYHDQYFVSATSSHVLANWGCQLINDNIEPVIWDLFLPLSVTFFKQKGLSLLKTSIQMMDVIYFCSVTDCTLTFAVFWSIC